MTPSRDIDLPEVTSRFTGFPSRAQATAIPNVFFTDILPELIEPLSITVALCAFHLLMSKKGFPRYVTRDELLSQRAVASLLEQNANGDVDAAEGALQRIVSLGVLLPLMVESDDQRRTLFFLNAPADRRGLEAVRTGTVQLGRVVPFPSAAARRPSVFALYESLIGTLSPLISDELADAERLYPEGWLEAAFREAAAQNARSWRYVSRLLERWAIEGPNYAKTERDPAGDGRYLEGKYGRILKERLER